MDPWQVETKAKTCGLRLVFHFEPQPCSQPQPPEATLRRLLIHPATPHRRTGSLTSADDGRAGGRAPQHPFPS